MNTDLCKHRHSRATHPRCFDYETDDEHPLAILVFDIETLPILAYVWGAWQQDLNVDGIVKDWCILSWSAKWLGDDKVISDILSSQEAIERDDSRLVKSFWKLLDRADVVITHNGREFDIKRVNTRFMYNGLTPPSSYKNIDTLVAARSVFGMTMNKLDYISKYLELDRKIHTDFALWIKCDNGNKKALRKMRDYNMQDVKMLEDVYLRIRGWIPNHPNIANIKTLDACPVCLGAYKQIGKYYTQKKSFAEYRCMSCGAIFHATKASR